MKWQTNQSAYGEQLSKSVYFAPQQENSGCPRACVMKSGYNAQWEFVVYGLWYATTDYDELPMSP